MESAGRRGHRPGRASLLTDLYLAQTGRTAQPLPTILIRTPYGRGNPYGLAARLFAERGYHAVVQSARGTFGSGGEIDTDARSRRRPRHRRLDHRTALVQRRAGRVRRQLPELHPAGPGLDPAAPAQGDGARGLGRRPAGRVLPGRLVRPGPGAELDLRGQPAGALPAGPAPAGPGPGAGPGPPAAAGRRRPGRRSPGRLLPGLAGARRARRPVLGPDRLPPDAAHAGHPDHDDRGLVRPVPAADAGRLPGPAGRRTSRSGCRSARGGTPARSCSGTPCRTPWTGSRSTCGTSPRAAPGPGPGPPPIDVEVMGGPGWHQVPDWPPAASTERWHLQPGHALSPEPPAGQRAGPVPLRPGRADPLGRRHQHRARLRAQGQPRTRGPSRRAHVQHRAAGRPRARSSARSGPSCT